MRLMLDTCAIIDLLTDIETLGKGAMALIDDPENVLFASAESMRELVVPCPCCRATISSRSTATKGSNL